MTTSSPPGHYPGRAPVDAYGNGGFRFASMSHKGSIIALPSGIWAWDVSDPVNLTMASLSRVFAEPRGGAFQFLLLGTGRTQVFPSPEIRRAFQDCGIGLDVMTTGAAARTYNVLLAEGRPLGAAMIAVS
ncbi:MAG: MTH938/NDUFAF3 family protein [Hyphomicrobiaceae bacterium]